MASRYGRPEVALVPHEVKARPALPAARFQAEGPRAAREPRVDVPVAAGTAHGPERVHGEDGEKRRVGSAEVERHGVASVDHDPLEVVRAGPQEIRVARDAVEIARVRVGRRRVQRALGGAFHVVRRQLLAVVHHDALPQDEAVGSAAVLDLPALGQVRHDARLVVEVDQAREDELLGLDAQAVGGPRRVEGPEVLRCGHPEDPAAPWSGAVAVGRRDRPGEWLAAAGEVRDRRGGREPGDPRATSRGDRAHRAGPRRAC